MNQDSPRGVCPWPHKMHYISPEFAESAADALRAREPDKHRRKRISAYWCVNGHHWHVGNAPAALVKSAKSGQ